jgi:hypothetical protein
MPWYCRFEIACLKTVPPSLLLVRRNRCLLVACSSGGEQLGKGKRKGEWTTSYGATPYGANGGVPHAVAQQFEPIAEGWRFVALASAVIVGEAQPAKSIGAGGDELDS